MSSNTQEGARLTRYLLGEISEAERERLEEEYFADDEAFEQVLSAEDDLIDAYARGELSAEERRRFKETFLTSARGRERVQFARSLAGAVTDARPVVVTPEQALRPARLTFFDALRASGAALRFALITAALGMVVGLTWLLFERVRMREEVRQLRAERTALSEKAHKMERRADAEQARSAELRARLEAERARPTPEAGQHGNEAVARQSSPRADDPPRGQARKDDVATARRAPGRARELITVTKKAPRLNTPPAELATRLDQPRVSELPLTADRRPLHLRLSTGGVSFVLTPGQVRGGGGNVLKVPDKTTSILLRLNLETNSSHLTYRAVIETADRRPVWRADSFKTGQTGGVGAAIALPPVPARELPPGDYILTLSGRRPDDSFEGVADYSFRVVRK